MFLDIRGQRVHVIEQGSGVPVVFVHSSGMSVRQWKVAMDVLAGDHRIVAMDLAGYGQSVPWEGAPEDAMGLDRDIVGAVCAWVGEPVHLVAHSYGGVLALAVAASSTIAVRSICVYEPVVFGLLHAADDTEGLEDLSAVDDAFFRSDLAGTEEWFRAFVDYWNGAGAWDAMPEDARRRFASGGAKTFHEVRALTYDRTPPETYAAIDAPALVLVGEETTVAAKHTCRLLADAMHAELSVVEGAGHLGPITHGRKVADRVRSFIERVDAGRSEPSR